jgi:hypothetical protein
MREFLVEEVFSSLKERQADLDGAEDWLRKADDSLKQFGRAPAQLSALLDVQAFYSRHKLYSKEADVITKVVAIWATAVAPDSRGVARYRCLLDQVYFEMGDDASSEANFWVRYHIFEKNRSSSAASEYAKHNLLKVLMKEEKRADVAQLIKKYTC